MLFYSFVLIKKHIIMKSAIIMTSMVVLSVFFVVACNKTNTTPTVSTTPNTPSNPTTPSCNGGNICFKLDGNQEVYTADWLKIAANSTAPERYRIYVAMNGGANPNIELDVFATVVGTYTVANNKPPLVNDAGFQYFEQNGRNIRGASGTVEITNIDNTNNTISGKFTITGDDNGTTYQITEGNFENVPLK